MDFPPAIVLAALMLTMLAHVPRSSRRRLSRQAAFATLVIVSATLLGLVGSTLGSHFGSAVPVAEAQSGSVVLLPRGSEWSYYYNGFSGATSRGRAPFTLNPCASPSGTTWASSSYYFIDMNATFYVEGPPQNVKVRIRAAATDASSSAQNNVIVEINGSNVDTWVQPYNECDSYSPWNREVSVSGSVLVNGLNTVHVKMGTPFNIPSPTATRRAIDVELVADSVGAPPTNSSFGLMAHAQGYSSDPVNTRTGNFTYQWSDVVIPGRGGGVSFSRAYNSLETRTSTLGPAWTHTYNTKIETSAESGWPSGTVRVVHWDGRTDRYTPVSGGGYAGPAGRLDELQYFSTPLSDGTVWLVTRPDYSKIRFDTNGRLIAFEDRNGNKATLTYNGSGQLTTITDPANRGSLTISYNGSGLISSISDWASPARTVTYDYDGSGRLWKVWNRENALTAYEYATGTNRLTKIIDANGHTAVENHYDGSARVDWQKDAKGNQTDFTYATDKTTQTLPVISFGSSFRPTIEQFYDGLGRLSKVVTTPASGETITQEHTYDAAWNRVAVKDGRGNTTSYCYDAYNQVTRIISPVPTTGTVRPIGVIEYDSASSGLQHEIVKATSPKGVSLSNSGDDPTDCFAPLTFDAQGLHQTSYVYDAQHNPIRTIRRYLDPDTSAVTTAITTTEYHATQPRSIEWVTPPRGNTASTPTSSNPDHSYATRFTYYSSGTKNGLLASTILPEGITTTFDYDAVGRRISMVDPNGNASGGSPSAHTWNYEYDKENRLLKAKTPAPTGGGSQLVTESQYDSVGNLTVLIDANGQVTKYFYDERDSLFEVWESPSAWTNPSSTPSPKYVTAYEYDNNSHLRRVIRAQGDSSYERVVEYAYDGLNRPRTETQYPNWPSTSGALVRQTSYDANSNVATAVDPLGQTTSYSYDRLNRLTNIDYPSSGTADVSYTYDFDGQRLTMSDGGGTTSYTYDAVGRLLAVTTPASPSAKTVGYRYDQDGNRTKLIYPNSEAVTYAYDKASRMTTVTDWASRVTSYAYSPDSALQTQTNANGAVAAYSYDNARRLTEVWNKPSATATDAITRHQFTLDAMGNRTQVVETLAPILPPPLQAAPGGLPTSHTLTPSSGPGGLPTGHPLTAGSAPGSLPTLPGPNTGPVSQTLTYGYDRLYQLTSASGGPAGSTTYTYDPVGNRLTRVRNGVTATSSYDRADRITGVTTPSSGTSYTVDANGNTTARGADTLAYDQANRLKAVDFASASTPDVTYTYDGDGRRISKTVSSTTTTYLYDVNRGLPVLLEDSARRYVWGQSLLYEVENSAAYVYHTDGRGSVRAITDSAKTVVQTYQTDEFGILLGPVATSGSSGQPFGFTGEQRDGETGFSYLRARMYDPQLGLFLQLDTVAGGIKVPLSLNRFAYVMGNPVLFRDPSGHDTLGTYAHQQIEAAFIARYPGFEREKAFTRASGSRFVVDLVNRSTRQFYEIKPWNERNAGITQVLDRLNHLPNYSGGPRVPDMWIQTHIPWVTLHVWSDPDWNGLLLYEWTTELPPIVPIPVPKPDRLPPIRLPGNFPNPQPVPRWTSQWPAPKPHAIN